MSTSTVSTLIATLLDSLWAQFTGILGVVAPYVVLVSVTLGAIAFFVRKFRHGAGTGR